MSARSKIKCAWCGCNEQIEEGCLVCTDHYHTCVEEGVDELVDLYRSGFIDSPSMLVSIRQHVGDISVLNLGGIPRYGNEVLSVDDRDKIMKAIKKLFKLDGRPLARPFDNIMDEAFRIPDASENSILEHLKRTGFFSKDIDSVNVGTYISHVLYKIFRVKRDQRGYFSSRIVVTLQAIAEGNRVSTLFRL